MLMTPREIVQELDKHIIGQANAKRAVATALRNRWRRSQVADESLRNDIVPKNIMMIGPTGVGKTEIARRLATLAGAPFVKVEATKYTEVGFVGRDVEHIIRDLMDAAVKLTREQEKEKVKHRAEEAAVERILDALLPSDRRSFSAEPLKREDKDTPARQAFRKSLLEGALDDKEIEIEVAQSGGGLEIMAPPGMEEMTSQLQSMFQSMSRDKKSRRRMLIKVARKILQDEEASKLINEEEIKTRALFNVEQNGIVFIDEIDKITARSSHTGGSADVSREGVQRDLLPLIEGTTVSTKYGLIKTDHILFITSGAFQLAKPSDLIPELQGRLPIRVELSSLDAKDFARILQEPKTSLTKQYHALMHTEGVTVEFSEDGIQKIAEIAQQVNDSMENIGARRLHTVLERLFDELSYKASDMSSEKVAIDKKYVEEHLQNLITNEDLSQYIL